MYARGKGTQVYRHRDQVEGAKGLSAPCLLGINHVSVTLNRCPPADRVENIGESDPIVIVETVFPFRLLL